MRKSERIEPFLMEIGSLWKERFPDWRFGQLMYNFFNVLGDPFYYEEDEFLEAFKAYCNRENPKEAIKKLREQKIDKETSTNYMEELNNFFEKFNLEEFQLKLKKEANEMNTMEDLE